MEALPTYAELRFTERPEYVAIRHQGKLIWEIKQPDSLELDQDLELEFDGHHLELAVEANWPQPGRQVVELNLIPDGLEEQAVHDWADGRLDVIFVYHWHGADSHD